MGRLQQRSLVRVRFGIALQESSSPAAYHRSSTRRSPSLARRTHQASLLFHVHSRRIRSSRHLASFAKIGNDGISPRPFQGSPGSESTNLGRRPRRNSLHHLQVPLQEQGWEESIAIGPRSARRYWTTTEDVGRVRVGRECRWSSWSSYFGLRRSSSSRIRLYGSLVSSLSDDFARPSLTFRNFSSGHVSVWQPKTAKRLDVRKVSLAEVTAMCGPSRFLWIGRAECVYSFFLSSRSIG